MYLLSGEYMMFFSGWLSMLSAFAIGVLKFLVSLDGVVSPAPS
jgi:uncharacterized membrane protein